MNVKLLASALWLILLPIPVAANPNNLTCLHNCAADEAGHQLIRSFEGYSPFPYQDTAGVPTIGYGHAIRAGESIEQPLLPPDAEKLLESDLRGKEKAINHMVRVPLRVNQFDALASFTYNVGEGSLARSTLLRKVNALQDAQVPAQFMLWDRAGGTVVRGLYLRRKAEAALYASKTP